MRNNIIRVALLGILLLGFTYSGVAIADTENKQCSNLGTWFGVLALGDTALVGYSGTVTGNSEKMGTNSFEFPTFDPSFAGIPELEELAKLEPFVSADHIGSLRGNWERVDKNKFAYTFMGFAFNASGEPVYVAKVSGHTEIFDQCRYQFVTAVMKVYLTTQSPFDSEPIATIPLGQFYGYRAVVDNPY